MRIVAFGLLAVLIGTSCGVLSRVLPCTERRHGSGLLIVCSDDVEPWKSASEELKGAVNFAFELAQAKPDAFGFPTPDFGANAVVLRIVRPEGETIARAWTASGAEIPMPKATLSLPRPAVAVRFEAATRSFALLTQIQHDVGPNLAGLPDADAIYQSGPDQQRNATRFVVDRESDALFRALAARYGTDALVIEVDSNRPNIRY